MKLSYSSRALFTVLLLTFILPFGVHARSPYQHFDGDVDIQVVDHRGREFRQHPINRYTDESIYRAYLEASEGDHYAIRIRNRSDRRIGLVIAVDGRNIISGKKSELKRNERMYVLGPYQQATYAGWRTGQNRINRFYFTEAENSYAGAWGDYTAMGVIAVAVYPERYDNRQRYYQKPDQPYRTPKALSEPGTGFGDEKWSPSRRVDFEPAFTPTAQHFIKYEWREALCRKGIISCRRPPNRFWDRDHDYGYAPHPPGKRYWRD